MGTSSIDQLYKIFTVLGQPISDWPEFARLAEACRFRATSSGSGLQSVLPRASSRAVAILSEILMLNPRRRPMARKVLEHSYFNFLPPLEMDRLDTARSGASASMMHYLPERSDSRNSFHFNDQGSLDFGAKLQASRPETPVLVPGFPPCPPSRPKSEVCVDDVDLDAELDKLLGLPTCNIFPPALKEETQRPEDWQAAQGLREDIGNYVSVREQEEDAKIEIDRLLDRGYAVKAKKEEVETAKFRGTTISKLGLIVKTKEGGAKKRRIIIDLRRSGGNRKAVLPERLILPRPTDAIAIVRTMHASKAETGNPQDRTLELVMIDVSDAYMHLAVAEEEKGHCLAPALDDDRWLLFIALLFGFKTAPLTWSRVAACVARLVQSVIPAERGMHQVYLDDSLWVLGGKLKERNHTLSCIIYTMAALGLRLSLGKGERAAAVTWIGVHFKLVAPDYDHMLVTLPEKFMDELQKQLEAWGKKGMIGTAELRKAAGRVAWPAGVLPRARWVTASMYATLYSHEDDVQSGAEASRRSQRKDSRPKDHLIPVKRVEKARTWLLSYLKAAKERPIRKYALYKSGKAEASVMTDASPLGIGAVLLVNGRVTKALASPINEMDAKLLGFQLGESSSQGIAETLAILVALKHWGKLLAAVNVAIGVQSDSVTALALTQKFSNSNASLNFLGAELAVVCEALGLSDLLPTHLPGVANKEADFLSRPNTWATTTLPVALEGISIETPQERSAAWYRLNPPGPDTADWQDGEALVAAWACREGPRMELAPADAIVLRPQELGGQPAPWLAYWAFYLIVIGIFAHVGAAWLGCKKFIAWWKTLHTPRGYPWTWLKAEKSAANSDNNTFRSESSWGLLQLVKRRRTLREKPEGEEKLKPNEPQRKRELLRERGGRDEGKISGTKKKRRRDLPQQPERAKGVKKNEKWKKAIQTARIFRSNRPQRDKNLQDFKEGYYANSSRRAKASVRKTVNKILLNLGTKGTAEQWSEETLERVGAVLKKADYKAGVTYLSEYKQMLIEAGKTWSHRLQRTFGQVARALKRARGPVKKAAEVEEDEWMEACKIETNEGQRGVVHRPALMFGFATVWMLREVELAAVHKEDIVINEKEKTVALTLRLTKCDQEAKGLKRTLQCCCPGDCDWSDPCPLAMSKAALDNVPIEEDHLVHGDSEGPIEIIGAWRKMFGQSISGHSARRSGALQYIRRGWHVPQVAFLGRWKSDVILQYAEEALETMPVMNKAVNLAGLNPGRGGNERVVEKLVVSKGDEQNKEAEKKLKKELDKLKDKQEQLDASILKWEEISSKHQEGMGMGGGMGGAPVDPVQDSELTRSAVKDLSDLTVKVSDKCLQGDARQTFALATQRAQDPGWLEKAAISQGPAELGAMADTITAYKKGNATGFGNRIGAAMRKVLLTNPDDIVTEKLPDEKTLPNVTGGFMKGFFGPGMSATITTPEEPNGIHIDLQKCVGNNVGLFQGVWASILKFYQNQGLPSTQDGRTTGEL
eukprot:g3564.t1